ncbi:MAG TPA: hypothetical protein VGF73_07275 [Chthoniobacterales bacterium]|jgi:hypothetical protein
MDLPGPPARSPGPTRAPGSGLKLMLAILVVFVLLVSYGQWQNFRRSKNEKALILPAASVSPSPAPNNH